MDNQKRSPSRPVMVRLPLDVYAEVEQIAQRERSSVATVLRRLAVERLEEIRERMER